MKHLIFIFAVVFASIAALPCQDSAVSQTPCGTEEAGHGADDQHSEEEAKDLCSPFCSCHCCQMHKVTVADSENAFIPLPKERKEPLTPALLSKNFFSIWHPPKA